MADEEETGYTWETAYEKTWEVLEEDETGSLEPSVQKEIHKAKRKKLLQQQRKTNVKLGIMRHVFVIIDLSQCMQEKDLDPTRQGCVLRLLETFVDEFFDQNPISQLGFITTQDKRAEKVGDLTGNARKHKEVLAALKEKSCVGEPSLQNSLELALKILKHLPSHASREVIIIMGSLSTCDPSNISSTVEVLKQYKVRCSVVGLAAEVQVCKMITSETKGSYSIMLDEHNLKDILASHTLPPPALLGTESNLVRMGFPEHKITPVDKLPSMCACHTEFSEKSKPNFTPSGYFCPQCQAKYCSLPVECRICGMSLVSGPQLARSYQHLFPLDPFLEEQLKENEKCECFGCFQSVEKKVYYCVKCSKKFCIDCDLLLHESIQTCPGCTL